MIRQPRPRRLVRAGSASGCTCRPRPRSGACSSRSGPLPVIIEARRSWRRPVGLQGTLVRERCVLAPERSSPGRRPVLRTSWRDQVYRRDGDRPLRDSGRRGGRAGRAGRTGAAPPARWGILPLRAGDRVSIAPTRRLMRDSLEEYLHEAAARGGLGLGKIGNILLQGLLRAGLPPGKRSRHGAAPERGAALGKSAPCRGRTIARRHAGGRDHHRGQAAERSRAGSRRSARR